jgi:hypothetical protein
MHYLQSVMEGSFDVAILTVAPNTTTNVLPNPEPDEGAITDFNAAIFQRVRMSMKGLRGRDHVKRCDNRYMEMQVSDPHCMWLSITAQKQLQLADTPAYRYADDMWGELPRAAY